MIIDCKGLHFRDLNIEIKSTEERNLILENCNGQRYIASGLSDKNITINGTPGNALGAYLDGCEIKVFGNAQEATGDTMNNGNIYIHGKAGDATGYAMRGGNIFVREDVGYRAGIHMKSYEDKVPTLVIGGTAGSFLGEYQAGGNIVVLGLNCEDESPVGRFCATGMHGGKIFLRCNKVPDDLPTQIVVKKATSEDMQDITKVLTEFSKEFSVTMEEILNCEFYVLSANSKNPYRQLYTYN